VAIQYITGTRINTLTTISTKSDLMTAIDSALTGASWTITTTTSSTDKIYQSVSSPQSNQIKIRVWDDGVSTCLRIRMMNNAQTIIQTDSCYLLPATSTQYRCIVNPYQFCIFVPGSVSSRNFVFGSALYLPTNLVSMGVTTAAFIMGDGGSDTDASNSRGSFRTSLTSRGFSGASPSQAWAIVNATAVEVSNASVDSDPHPGLITLVCLQSAATHAISGYRWGDDSALLVEPLVAWGTPNIDSDAKIRGQLWDSFVSTESYPADVSALVDTHTYYNLTESNDGFDTLPASMRGSLFVVTT
jgi:hypothetical protein